MPSNLSSIDAVAVKRALTDPLVVLAALGLDAGARREGRSFKVFCPWHEERSPSCSVRVGSDGTLAVHCFGCGAGGDVFALIAAARGRDLRHDFKTVLAAAAEMAGAGGDQYLPATRRVLPPQRPPQRELTALWNASYPVNSTRVAPAPADLAVAAFLSQRRLWPGLISDLDLARVSPRPDDYSWPGWWPRSWADRWPLVVRAFDAHGASVSLHARAVFPGTTPKTRWPRGCDARGLFFANACGQELLCAAPPADLSGVLLVEGLTDFLAASVEVADAGRPLAVLGGTAGSFPSLGGVRWPDGAPAFVLTDADGAGDRYANEIRAALPHADVRRLRPGSVTP